MTKAEVSIMAKALRSVRPRITTESDPDETEYRVECQWTSSVEALGDACQLLVGADFSRQAFRKAAGHV